MTDSDKQTKASEAVYIALCSAVEAGWVSESVAAEVFKAASKVINPSPFPTPGSLAGDLDYLRRRLADEATSAFDQSTEPEHWPQKRWELIGINRALRYAQGYIDWLLDVKHRPGGPHPLVSQTPPTLQGFLQ